MVLVIHWFSDLFHSSDYHIHIPWYLKVKKYHDITIAFSLYYPNIHDIAMICHDSTIFCKE